MALRLAHAGYWSGDPERILGASADVVMTALHFEGFRVDYERAYIELNKERK